MDLLYSIFFGAGASAIVYVKMGRRLGYQNQQNVWTVVGITFVMATIFFYTILAVILNVH